MINHSVSSGSYRGYGRISCPINREPPVWLALVYLQSVSTLEVLAVIHIQDFPCELGAARVFGSQRVQEAVANA